MLIGRFFQDLTAATEKALVQTVYLLNYFLAVDEHKRRRVLIELGRHTVTQVHEQFCRPEGTV